MGSEEQDLMAYANWGKFIELSSSFVPWDQLLDIQFSEPIEMDDGVFVRNISLAFKNVDS